MAVRAASVFSLDAPIGSQTSGDEQSSLFTIWRYIHHLPIYFDRFTPPFSLASYNWFFYYSYGTLTDLTLKALGLSEAWIPMIGRGITLAGTLVVGAASYALISTLSTARTPAFLRLCLALSMLLAVGPLAGFWALTVRPDIWALAFEILACVAFFRLYDRKPVPAIITIAVLLYSAWSFKQTAILATGTIGLALLLRNRWRHAFLLGGILASLYGLTFAVGGTDYATNVLFIGVPLSYSAKHVGFIALNFTPKTLPLLLPAAALVYIALRKPHLCPVLLGDRTVQFTLIGLMSSVTWALLATRQTGSAENYYFTAAFFMVMGVAGGIALFVDRLDEIPLVFAASLAVGWLANFALIAAVLLGIVGETTIPAADTVKSCLDRLPRPVFIASNLESLPWNIPNNDEHYVLSDFYRQERAMGKIFANDGIGGRIRRGEFASIVLGASSDQQSVPASFDGGGLGSYTPATPTPCPELSRWVVFLRRGAP